MRPKLAWSVVHFYSSLLRIFHQPLALVRRRLTYEVLRVCVCPKQNQYFRSIWEGTFPGRPAVWCDAMKGPTWIFFLLFSDDGINEDAFWPENLCLGCVPVHGCDFCLIFPSINFFFPFPTPNINQLAWLGSLLINLSHFRERKKCQTTKEFRFGPGIGREQEQMDTVQGWVNILGGWNRRRSGWESGIETSGWINKIVEF